MYQKWKGAEAGTLGLSNEGWKEEEGVGKKTGD